MQELLHYRLESLSAKDIYLRLTTPDDQQVLANWWNEPQILLGNRNTLFPTPVEFNSSLFETWSNNQDQSGFGLTIALKDGTCVGHVTIFKHTLPNRVATLGILVGPPFQKKGYGRQAILLALNLAFNELNAQKVELQAHSFNTPALRLYESIGFVHEGRRRHASYHGGQYYDVLIMGMLDVEYRQLKQQ